MLVRVHRYPSTGATFPEVFDFEQEVDNLFHNFLNPGLGVVGDRYPRVDVRESDTETIVAMELPGVGKEDVKVSVHDALLTVSGKRERRDIPEKSKWIRNEIPQGEFSRSVPVPTGIEASKIQAELTNGILRIALPKPEVMHPREIKIS